MTKKERLKNLEDEFASHCYFCGSKDILLPRVGIGFSMSGWTYSFCKKCLDKPAHEFWKIIVEDMDYSWPPRLIDPSRAVDDVY